MTVFSWRVFLYFVRVHCHKWSSWEFGISWEFTFTNGFRESLLISWEFTFMNSWFSWWFVEHYHENIFSWWGFTSLSWKWLFSWECVFHSHEKWTLSRNIHFLAVLQHLIWNRSTINTWYSILEVIIFSLLYSLYYIWIWIMTDFSLFLA
jgi:hypothetical protein